MPADLRQVGPADGARFRPRAHYVVGSAKVIPNPKAKLLYGTEMRLMECLRLRARVGEGVGWNYEERTRSGHRELAWSFQHMDAWASGRGWIEGLDSPPRAFWLDSPAFRRPRLVADVNTLK